MSEGELLWKLLLIAIAVSQVINIFIGWRRRPAVVEELYRDFATKAELQQLRQEFLKTSGEIFEVMRNLKESSVIIVGQVNRLDGILSRCPGPVQCQKERPG